MLQKSKLIALTLLMLIIGLVACGDNNDTDDNGTNNNNESSNGVDLGDEDITIAYVPWADYEARLHVIAQVLKNIGYNVDLKEMEAGPMFTSVSDGSADFTSMWLPSTHTEYWDEYQDNIEKVNQVLDKAPLSLAVPTYMADDVDSIEDLKDNDSLGESVDWTITGIDPGAGIMMMTEKAMEEYELDNWNLEESSEAAMLATLSEAYDNEEPIIFTGWEPHFMFGMWDLTLLDDPKEIYVGDGDQIFLVARDDFESDSPAAYKVLEQYTENYDRLNELMGDIEETGNPEEVAEQFVDDNEDLVNEWTEGNAK